MESENRLTHRTIDNVAISYTGIFDTEILSVLAKEIEGKLSADDKINKKVFKIFIELAQNISFYSLERELNADGSDMGVGTMIIRDFGKYFEFSTGNKTTMENIIPVMEKCDNINSMDHDKLREYRRLQRNMPAGAKGGGNIGLIQVALTANSKIEYSLIKCDDGAYFYIVSVRISKEPDPEEERPRRRARERVRE
ncbi:MAG: SiaB family protein kinase [Bacteroidales bacterium]|nr:SiaB family protein kinase [Bacteroidales bacterium]